MPTIINTEPKVPGTFLPASPTEPKRLTILGEGEVRVFTADTPQRRRRGTIKRAEPVVVEAPVYLVGGSNVLVEHLGTSARRPGPIDDNAPSRTK